VSLAPRSGRRELRLLLLLLFLLFLLPTLPLGSWRFALAGLRA
jgi:hypothetical protein